MFFRYHIRILGTLLSLITLGGIITACGVNESTSNSMNHEKIMDHNHSVMELGPADTEYDLRFIDAMIPHHEGAVIMAQDVLAKSQRTELLELATEIINAQEQEIEQMKQWRKNWYPQALETPMTWNAQMNHSMAMSEEQIEAMRMDMDLGVADENYDRRFLETMILHHQTAVEMAEDVLEKSERSEIKELANNIITSQQMEIDQMNGWLNDWYGN
jgi:uncharacterized protein (DUF305 family)